MRDLLADLNASPVVEAPQAPLSPVADAVQIGRAHNYLRDKAPVKPHDGGTACFISCQELVQRYKLDDVSALALMREVYNPRCAKAEGDFSYVWSDKDISRKLSEARNRSLKSREEQPDFLKKLLSHAEPGQPPAVVVDVPATDLRDVPMEEIISVLHDHDAWRGKLRMNVLTRKPLAVDPPIPMRLQWGQYSAGDAAGIAAWFAAQGMRVAYRAVDPAVQRVYELPDAGYNPVAEYLEGLVWDGVPRIGSLHTDVLRSTDASEAGSLLGKHLVASVRRILAVDPRNFVEVDHQYVVVLCGEQNTGKSRFVKTLGGPWYACLKGDLGNKDTVLKLRGSWIVEIEEMASARRAERNALKAFLSGAFDHDRMAYERDAEKVPRSYVLFGSANDLSLEDPTGSRRFVCIKVGSAVDIAKLEGDRDQIWAEATALAKTSWSHHPTLGEEAWVKEQNKDFECDDLLVSHLERALVGVPFITGPEAYAAIRGPDADKWVSDVDRRMLVDALLRVGCRRVRNAGVRGYKVPDKLAKMSPDKAVIQRITMVGNIAAQQFRKGTG